MHIPLDLILLLSLGVPLTIVALRISAPALGYILRVLPGRDTSRSVSHARRQEEALSIVFHELRRPLASLVSASELALDSEIPPEERNDLLRTVHRQALRLNDYLEEILEAARLQSGRVWLNHHPLDLCKLVQEECEEFANGRHSQDLQVSYPRTAVLVAGDDVKLRMVVDNLLANAFTYSTPGEDISVRVVSENGVARVEVQDRGPGVAEPYREQIFEPFFRIPGATERGFGLGLYIARQLVQAHMGSIRVEPGNPTGSLFVVELPVLKRVSVAKVSEVSSPTSRSRRRSAPVHIEPASK